MFHQHKVYWEMEQTCNVLGWRADTASWMDWMFPFWRDSVVSPELAVKIRWEWRNHFQLGKAGLLPPTGLNHINGLNGFGPGVLSPAGWFLSVSSQPSWAFIFPALAALAGGGGRGASSHQTHEMTVPNEIIGCVIGKGGSKIAEIRWDFLIQGTKTFLSSRIDLLAFVGFS